MERKRKREREREKKRNRERRKEREREKVCLKKVPKRANKYFLPILQMFHSTHFFNNK